MQKEARIIGICLSRVQEEYRLQCIKAFNQHASAKGYRLFIFKETLIKSSHYAANMV